MFLYIFLGILLVFTVLSYGCLRNKLGGFIPVLASSCIASGIITAIICTVWYVNSDDTVTETVSNSYVLTHSSYGSQETLSANRLHFKLDTLAKYGNYYRNGKWKNSVYVETVSRKVNKKLSELTFVDFNTCREVVSQKLYLNKKDYEILETYKNNAN